MKPVRIEVYSTHIRIDSTNYGDVCDGLGDIRKVLDRFKETDFDKRQRRVFVTARYYFYNRQTAQMHLPRHALKIVVEHLKSQNIPYDICVKNSYVDRLESPLQMLPHWVDRPEHQNAINHLTRTDEPMLCCSMQTGKGKTYCATKSSISFETYILVLCSGLLEQWKENFLEKTTVDEKDIFVIQGVSSVQKIIHILETDKEHRPKILIGSIETVRLWVLAQSNPYDKMMTWFDFLNEYGIGVKIDDEFHLNFAALVLIDLMSNVQTNMYLSATPKRSKSQAQAILNRIFPSEIIGGQNQYDKYIDTTMYTYRLEVNKPQRFNTNYGYSHAKYEMELINNSQTRKRFVNEVLFPIVDSEYVNVRVEKGQKCLIFVQTVAFAQRLQQYLDFYYNGRFDIRTYLSDDPEDNLFESDIIVSTPKSCGTGVDIKNLITVINTVSFSSEPLCEQMFGRIRKIVGPMKFIDLANSYLQQHLRHSYKRKKIFYPRSKSFNKLKL